MTPTKELKGCLSGKELFGVGMTASRYLLAQKMSARVKKNKSIGASMIALIAADIGDGVIMRHINSDTPVRRVADGITDHASQVPVASAIYNKNRESRMYIRMLAGRAMAVGAINLAHYVATGEITKGNNFQRASNIASAVFAVAANNGGRAVTKMTGGIAVGIAISTGVAHIKEFGKLHDNGIRNI